jgi:hypothetical protein
MTSLVADFMIAKQASSSLSLWFVISMTLFSVSAKIMLFAIGSPVPASAKASAVASFSGICTARPKNDARKLLFL